MLGVVHAVHFARSNLRGPTGGGKRVSGELGNAPNVYRGSYPQAFEQLAGNCKGGRCFTIDSEVWFPLYEDAYDQQGQLWQDHIYWLTYR